MAKCRLKRVQWRALYHHQASILVNTVLFWIFHALITVQLVVGDGQFKEFKFSVEPKDTIAIRDGQAYLDCVVDGHPKPTIEWKREGMFLSLAGDNRRRILSNGTLFFEKIIHSRSESPDEGKYQCVASIDSIGTIVSRSVRLQVASLPRFDEQPNDLNVLVGQTARFECSIQGVPPANIRWLKDDHSLLMDDARMLILPSGSLEIFPVEASDAGNYKCNASNIDKHKVSFGGKLVINNNFAEAEIITAPVFITKPKNTIATEGKTVTLECAANGNPEPTITWLKDGDTIDFSNLDSNFHRVGVGSLQIENIQESDLGIYMCRAENYEDSFDASATLDIQVPPRIVRKPSNQIIQAKEDVEFECEIYGKPEPTIKWLKNGDLVIASEYFQIDSNHNLKILGSVYSDAGIYQCIGTNPAGNVQATAQLVIIDPDATTASTLTTTVALTTPVFHHDTALGQQIVTEKIPSPPRDLTAVIVSTRFVTLSWREPETTHGAIIAYSVFYLLESSTRERVVNTTRARLEEINIPGLRPSTRYHFRVVAFNKYGPGKSSDKILVETKAEANVPGSPTNLRVNAVSPTALVVRWDPPMKMNGLIDEYKLYYMEIGTSEEHEVTTPLTSYMLEDLRKYTEYSVWVVAINRNGPGSSTEETSARTYSDVPDATPQNFSVEAFSSTSVTVRWEPPPEDEQNGIITGYKIRYIRFKQKGKRRGETVTTDRNRRLYTITGLERGIKYNIRISALTVNGSGPVTNWKSVETYENDLDESSHPGKPTLRIVKPGSDSIFLSWDPPTEGNVMVRGYTIGWGKGFPDHYNQDLDGKQRHFTIENLELGAEYVISLRAFNHKGDGIPTYETVKTSRKSTPEPTTPLIPPMELVAIILTEDTVVLSWTDNTLRGKQVVTDNRYYKIRYSIYYSPNPRYKYFNSTDLNCMIGDLKPNTQYEFSVKVVKGKRQSPWSLSVLNTTFEAKPSSPPRDLTVVGHDNDPVTISLNWQPPKQPNGKLKGYVILYTTDDQLRDRDWVADGVTSNKLTKTISGLTVDTRYYFKIQAHNNKGYGPFSQTVVWTTSDDMLGSSISSHSSGRGSGRKTKNVKNAKASSASSDNPEHIGFTLYIVIACVSVITLIIIIVVTVIQCCPRSMRPFGDGRKRGYGAGKQSAKGKGANKDIKPPDLWIHHDQMELKGHDKSQSQETSMTLTPIPRSTKDINSDNDSLMSTLDRRGNTSYISSAQSLGHLSDRPPSLKRQARPKIMISVDPQARPPRDPIATPIPNGSMSNDGPGSSLLSRPVYPRTQYNTPRAHVSLDAETNEVTSPVGHPQSNYDQPPNYDQLVSAAAPIVSPGNDPSYQSTSYKTPNPPIEPNSGNGTLGRRPSGHPLKSFSVPAPPPQSAPCTPQPKQPRAQVSASPQKKTSNPSNKPLASGVAVVTPRAPTEAVKNEDLRPSYSTEELNQEMANLEGLMKDLNAITASQFECQ